MIMINKTKVKELKAKTDEQARLVQKLDYYWWLEDQGLSWKVIAGITKKIPYSPKMKFDYKKSCLKLGTQYDKDYVGAFISFKLKNGESVICKYPPYDENVIFNRKEYPQ